MLKTIPDEVVDGELKCRHTIEIYCPACGRDVDEVELAALKCNDCGHSLADPKQSVSVEVANLSFGGLSF